MRCGRRSSTAGSRRGASAVEFALILPLMTMLILGGIDFGRYGYYYIAVTNAAEAGASNAMMNNYTASTINTWKSNITTAARQEMTSMTGYSSADLAVTVNTSQDAVTSLRRAQVTASYPFQTIVNMNWQGNGRTINLARTVEVRLIR